MKTMMTLKVVREEGVKNSREVRESSLIYYEDPNMVEVEEELVQRRDSAMLMQSIFEDSVLRNIQSQEMKSKELYEVK